MDAAAHDEEFSGCIKGHLPLTQSYRTNETMYIQVHKNVPWCEVIVGSQPRKRVRSLTPMSRESASPRMVDLETRLKLKATITPNSPIRQRWTVAAPVLQTCIQINDGGGCPCEIGCDLGFSASDIARNSLAISENDGLFIGSDDQHLSIKERHPGSHQEGIGGRNVLLTMPPARMAPSPLENRNYCNQMPLTKKGKKDNRTF